MPGAPRKALSSSSGSARPRAPAIGAVAAAAGVSAQTVSRVVNGKPRVSAATRERVLAAVRELGYRPNGAARILAGAQSRGFAVLTSNTTLYGYAATIRGIEEAASAAGYFTGITVLESADSSASASAVERATQQVLAGVIALVFDLAGAEALRHVPPDVPVVGVGSGAGECVARATVDERAGAASATRYLLDLGHRTVHHISVPSWWPSPQDRQLGWQDALGAAGVPVPDVVVAGWDPASGYEAARQIAFDPAVTAILCGNDDVALGALRALREAGRDVPGEVSVVGFDDTPQSAYFMPALTTVRQDFVGLGRQGFRMLADQLATGRREAQTFPAECELIVRDSAGPPPWSRRATSRPRRNRRSR